MIAASVPNIPDLDAFLEQEIMPEGVWLVRKRQIKQSNTLNFAVNGGAKLVHPGGAKLVHLTLCGTRCWGVVPVVHRRDPRCFV